MLSRVIHMLNQIRQVMRMKMLCCCCRFYRFCCCWCWQQERTFSSAENPFWVKFNYCLLLLAELGQMTTLSSLQVPLVKSLPFYLYSSFCLPSWSVCVLEHIHFCLGGNLLFFICRLSDQWMWERFIFDVVAVDVTVVELNELLTHRLLTCSPSTMNKVEMQVAIVLFWIEYFCLTYHGTRMRMLVKWLEYSRWLVVFAFDCLEESKSTKFQSTKWLTQRLEHKCSSCREELVDSSCLSADRRLNEAFCIRSPSEFGVKEDAICSVNF